MEKTEIIKIIISAVFIFIIYPLVRFLARKIVNNVAKFNLYDASRTRIIKKTLNAMIIFVLITILVSLWGVDTKNLLLALSSVFAIIGVAFFAQWSILSNITAGIVIYFSLPLKIGDRIKILDKDLVTELVVIDIKLFYISLETDEGEKIIYPNSLLLQKGVAVLTQQQKLENS
ncbi:MAG: mechanosensitive ion channel family protein [Bacteroidales bacterium]|jgi:small-conductance mechanosensitive channel|nr:mechanosensitive ion channel family protein [Bacteroidales bacterium]